MRRVLPILVLGCLLAGCTPGGSVGDGGPCPDPPALAAAESILATSCPMQVTFEGRAYFVAGAKFHKTWVGRRIAEPGETRYGGAYRLRFFGTREVIVLGSTLLKRNGFTLAYTDAFTEEDFARIRRPFLREERSH